MHILIPALHRPTEPTGVCRHAVNLAQALAETDQVCRVTLLIGAWQRTYFKQVFNLDSAKISLVTVEINNTSLARNQWFVFGLPKLAQTLSPDIIHMSFPFPFVRQWFNVPVLATVHDLYPYVYPENFGYPRVWFNQLFLQQCIHNSDGLICVSHCTLEALLVHFPKVKRQQQATVVYNVVDFTGVDASQPARLANQFSQPFLISVAQHRKNKNLDILIRAYSILLHEEQIDPCTRLILVGSPGPETDALHQLVEVLHLENRVMFLAGLEDEELRWLYEQADLFVIPSSTEGFCLPLVEALTLSCPAVCSDIPIFREVGTSGCHFFELGPKAHENLVEAITLALSNEKKQESPISNQFSRQAISQHLLNAYQALGLS